MAEKRGPRIGDAASLWNFTPAPGWTKEEAHTLKLCLMRHGVGRWVQILETGLLPGKLIQQLNGQTQRLLGQQSLAAYTGLQVDIDRIRADNDALTDAERKNGLVINSGPNLTKQQKQQLQEEARAKYGLSEQELREVDEQLQELAASRPQPAGAGPAAAGLPDAQAAAGAEERRAQREAELLGRDTVGMSKEQKINFLLHLHEKLQQAAARLAKAAAAGAVEAPHPGAAAAAGAAPAACLTVPAAAFAAIPAAAHLPENHGAVANAVTMQLDAAAAVPGRAADVVVLPEAAWAAARRVPPAAAARPAGAKRKAAGKGRQSRQASSSTSEDEDWCPEPRQPSGRGRRGAAAAEAMDVDGGAAPRGGGARSAAAAAAAADVEQLTAMGFSARQARDALEECDFDVEAAIEWLVAHCM